MAIELNTDTTYNVGIFFYNDSDPDNIENVTLEVIEEGSYHIKSSTKIQRQRNSLFSESKAPVNT